MMLGARPLRDSLWLEFSQPREGSNNSLTNGNSSGGKGKEEDEEEQKLDCAVLQSSDRMHAKGNVSF